MKIITKRDRIRTVPERWKEQYPGPKRLYRKPRFPGETSDDVYNDLLDLDLKTCTEKDVAKIIGNNWWTEIPCSGCGARVNKAVSLDYSNSDVFICYACAEKIQEVVSKRVSKKKPSNPKTP